MMGYVFWIILSVSSAGGDIEARVWAPTEAGCTWLRTTVLKTLGGNVSATDVASECEPGPRKP